MKNNTNIQRLPNDIFKVPAVLYVLGALYSAFRGLTYASVCTESCCSNALYSRKEKICLQYLNGTRKEIIEKRMKWYSWEMNKKWGWGLVSSFVRSFWVSGAKPEEREMVLRFRTLHEGIGTWLCLFFLFLWAERSEKRIRISLKKWWNYYNRNTKEEKTVHVEDYWMKMGSWSKFMAAAKNKGHVNEEWKHGKNGK